MLSNVDGPLVVGSIVGDRVDDLVGNPVVGSCVGGKVGDPVVGSFVGDEVGDRVGDPVGETVVGLFVGDEDVDCVGNPVGVGDPLQREGSLNRFGSLILYNLPSEVPKYNSPFTSSPNVVTPPPAVESDVVSEFAFQTPLLRSLAAPRINPFT